MRGPPPASIAAFPLQPAAAIMARRPVSAQGPTLREPNGSKDRARPAAAALVGGGGAERELVGPGAGLLRVQEEQGVRDRGGRNGSLDAVALHPARAGGGGELAFER